MLEISSLIAAAFEPFPWQDAGRGTQVLVLDRSGRIDATVAYYADATLESLGLPHGWAGFRTLAVHPRARGQGFGRQLVDRCIDNARRDGKTAVGIHSAAFMERACGMYERVGFVPCPKYDIFALSILGFDREPRRRTGLRL